MRVVGAACTKRSVADPLDSGMVAMPQQAVNDHVLASLPGETSGRRLVLSQPRNSSFSGWSSEK